MSQRSLIRKLNRKRVTLEHLTRQALEEGALPTPDGETEITVMIRRVNNMEVTKLIGTPPSMLRAARMRQDGESDEDWNKRYQQLLEEDDELRTDSIDYTSDLKRVIVTLGVVEPRVVLHAPEGSEDDPERDMLPEDFGPDLDTLYEHVCDFSGLPYATRQGKEGDGLATFLEEPDSGAPEPHGALLRSAPNDAPEPDVG